MAPSFVQLLVVVLLVVLLFGRGKISDLMGDFAKGIKSFKQGLSDDDDAPAATDSKKIEDRAKEKIEASAVKENAHVG